MAFWKFWRNWGKKPALAVITCRHCERYVHSGQQHYCLSGVRGANFMAPVKPTQSTPAYRLSYVGINATADEYARFAFLSDAVLSASSHNHHPTFMEPDRFNDQWSSGGSGGSGKSFIASSRNEEPTRQYEAPEVTQVCSRNDYTTPDTDSTWSSGSSDPSPTISFSTD